MKDGGENATYSGGDFVAPEIALHRFPGDAILVSSSSFEVDVSGVRVAEQSHPFQLERRREVAPISEVDTAEVIEGEHLLIGRWGHRTWGHWLGELLPKIALVEEMYPGRFSYITSVMPFAAKSEPGVRDAWTSYRESLEALGIDGSRITAMPRGRAVRFEAWYGVDPVYVSGVFHPAALAMMKDRAVRDLNSESSKIAVISRKGGSRGLANATEVSDVVADAGFSLLDPGSMSFGEQVAHFASARHVIGILGSGLTGAIFGPRGIRVLALGPERFSDRFFYGITRARQGLFFDLRGESQGDDPRLSPFLVDCRALTEMLQSF